MAWNTRSENRAPLVALALVVSALAAAFVAVGAGAQDGANDADDANAANANEPLELDAATKSWSERVLEREATVVNAPPAVRFNLPIIGIVGNDGAWGQMMRPQGALYGSVENTLLNYTRYDKVVEALGGHGEHVERPEDLRPALERAAASGKPACINVVIRQDREDTGRTYV